MRKGATGSLFDLSLPELVAISERRVCDARPVDANRSNSQWQTSPRVASPALKHLAGASSYTAKIGARTDPYGVFQVRILKKIGKGVVLIQNCARAGKREIESVERPMEVDILFPLIRGRDVADWVVQPEVYVPMVQDPATRAAIPEGKLRRQCPKAYDYFCHFKPELLKRGSGAVQAVMDASAFYAMFAVGVETFAPFKVVWRRMGNIFRTAVVSSVVDKFLGSKVVIPSDTVTFVPFDKEEEAFFFAGLIGSSPAKAAIYSFSPSGRGLGAPGILKQLRIDTFKHADAKLRRRIARAAQAVTRECSSTTVDASRVRSCLEGLDVLAAEYWGLGAKALATCAAVVGEQEARAT